MIYGNKVGLRALEKSDLTQLRDWRNIPSFRRNFREHRELGMANQEAWFNKVSTNPNDFMFIIENLADGRMLGACGLLYVNWIIRSADYSFYIGDNKAYIDNEGFAAEASELLLSYGFKNLNLNKIWMELYEFDHKKIDFFTSEGLGFQVDGKLRSNCFEDGKYHDSVILSLLYEDFVALKSN